MNRYDIENAAFQIKGYYRPPMKSDHTKGTVEERFEEAKKEALGHMKASMENIENLTLAQFFPKYRKGT